MDADSGRRPPPTLEIAGPIATIRLGRPALVRIRPAR